VDKYLSRPEENILDILRDTAIDTEQKLKHPRLVRKLRLKISGIDVEDIPFDGHRQRIINKDEGIIEIAATRPAAELPEYDGIKQFLQPSPWIDSDNPKIMETARRIAGSEKDTWNVAVKINRWLYQNLEKIYSPEIPVASSILESRRGDCNEHTVLFIALARALGIPATMSTGLVYANDGFFYHAWPKVHVGRWIPLDPTFGQSIADATHLEIASGDFSAQAKIAMTMGKINIKILNTEY
jgi:transglutaminase-like putative cysteine protease